MSEDIKKKLIESLGRPFVRLSLRSGINLKEIITVLKTLLVEEAQNELIQKGESITNSRLSVMTGVHRKDVEQIISNGTPQSSSQSSIIARVIGQWKANPHFRRPTGTPKVLTADGGESEFAKLVATVSREIGYYSLLVEMERRGIIKYVNSKDSKTNVRLVIGAVITSGLSVDSLKMLQDDTQDLAESIFENMNSKEDSKDHIKNLHLKTQFDNIPDEVVPKLKKWLLTEGTKFHRKVERYLSQFDKDINQSLKDKPGKNRVAALGFSRVESMNKKDHC
jgi:hypothetical protein